MSWNLSCGTLQTCRVAHDKVFLSNVCRVAHDTVVCILVETEFLLLKKLEIEKNKTTFIISVFKDVYWVVLVSSISNFFINKTSAN